MRERKPGVVAYRGKWCLLTWIGGERKRLSLGLDATAENRAAAEAAGAALAGELSRATAGRTCGEIWAAYLADKKVSERPLLSEDRAANAWKQLDGHFGRLLPEEVTREVCRAYIAKRRAAGRQDGTIRRELTALRAALLWKDKRSPAVFELPPAPAAKDAWITRSEFDRLLNACEHEHLRLFLRLGIATAARKEALFALTWMQVRFDRSEIFLGLKAGGKKRATVPLGEKLRASLLEIRQKAKTDYVIEFRGEPVKSVRTSLHRACVRAGLIVRDDAGQPVLDEHGEPTALVTPHVLRHSAAIWMLQAGTPLHEVSDYLGHSDISVTKRVYGRYQAGHLSKAGSAVDV